MAGYSGTPLYKKLGLQAGMRVRLVHAPGDYADRVAPVADGLVFSSRLRKDVDLCHLFVTRAAELQRRLPELMTVIRQNGCIWVSWPKKASGVATDITETTIRDKALPLGLVDIKVCAVDEIWSGLKLVIRKENRQ